MSGLLLVTAACMPWRAAPDPGVKVVVPALPTTLDWSTSDVTSWVNFPVMLATQRGLTTLDAANRVQPCLARSWERSVTAEGHERYRFSLRTDVTWSDGAPLTAQDFVLGWRRALVGQERGDLADLLGADAVFALLERGAGAAALEQALERVGARALSPSELEVTLERPRSYFLARLANVYVYFPVPAHDLAPLSEEARADYFDRPKDGKPRALGPFRVDSWDRAGERLRLVRNPRSAFAPRLSPGERPVEAVTLLRSDVASALYARGRVDFMAVDDPLALAQGAGDAARAPLLSTYFLGFNTRRPPLDQTEVRRALAMAIDRGALFAGLLPDPRLTRVLVPEGVPGGVPAQALEGLPPYAPDEARRVLARAFRPERPLRLVYSAAGSFLPEVAVAERLKGQLARVGVRVSPEPRADFSAELARVASDGYLAPDLFLRRVGADYAHPNSFFTLFGPEGNHFTGWEALEGGEPMRRLAGWLLQADAQPDPVGAAPLYGKAEALLLGDQVVLVPLLHPDRYFRVRPRVAGLSVSPFNFLSLSEVRWAAGGPR